MRRVDEGEIFKFVVHRTYRAGLWAAHKMDMSEKEADKYAMDLARDSIFDLDDLVGTIALNLSDYGIRVSEREVMEAILEIEDDLPFEKIFRSVRCFSI